MVLHRAGYSFFGKVSFSALIAANGYAYYEAVNSLLRKENGGDMTYFLDYFLQLLAHAAGEYRRKVEEDTTKTVAAERQMAGTVLAPTNYESEPEKEKIPEMDIKEFTFLASGDPYSDDHGDSLDSANADTLVEETTEEDTGQRKSGEWVGESRIRERLERPINARSQDYKILLLQYLKTGKYSFDSKEVSGILGKNQNTVTAYLRKLMEEKIVTITRDKPGMTMIYSFYRGDDQFVEADYSDELISI